MFPANIGKVKKIKNKGKKNGIACTTARVIQIKNEFSRRVAVNVKESSTVVGGRNSEKY